MIFKGDLKRFATAIVLIITTISTEARHVRLLPLTANQVYEVLQKAGREDSVPEGRIITQGIAAVTGFGAGLLSGIGGALIFDLLTAPDDTAAWLNGVFGWRTALGMAASPHVSEEICFLSRNLDDDFKRVPQSLDYGRSTQPTTAMDGYSPTFTSNAEDDDAEDVPYTSTTTNEDVETTCIVVEKPNARSRRKRRSV